LLSEIDQGAAVGAGGKMGEHLLLLVCRQHVFDESVEMVRVWMMSGLEEMVHLAVGCWLLVARWSMDAGLM